ELSTMNSTYLPAEDEAILERDVVFWFSTIIQVIGCITEFILLIFFCTKVFFTRKKNDLRSSYFLIIVIGYVIDIISSGSGVLNQFVDPAFVTSYSTFSKFT